MWDLPRPGLEPVSPALAGRFSTTAPPGKPHAVIFCKGSLFDIIWKVIEENKKYSFIYQIFYWISYCQFLFHILGISLLLIFTYSCKTLQLINVPNEEENLHPEEFIIQKVKPQRNCHFENIRIFPILVLSSFDFLWQVRYGRVIWKFEGTYDEQLIMLMTILGHSTLCGGKC